jgi:hypothetical protein
MRIKVYHGSDTNIELIDLTKCKPAKDFGQGFYVTGFRWQAEDMAKRVAGWHNTMPIVTEFEFEDYAFEDNDFRVLRFDAYSEEWLDFILLNRNNIEHRQAHDFDIVEGPVADDEITSRIHDYLRGEVSKTAFLEELKFKKNLHQMCFCTTKSLQMLVQTNDGADVKMMHIDDDIVEALMNNFGWLENKATDLYYASKTYARLIDETTGLYLKPWTEIYQLLLQELS